MPLQRTGEESKRRIAAGDRQGGSHGCERSYLDRRTGGHDASLAVACASAGLKPGAKPESPTSGKRHLGTVDLPHEQAGGLRAPGAARRAVTTGSSGAAPKRSSTLVPRAEASARATSSEGDQRPDSIPEIDWRVTPAMSASAPWDRPRASRERRKRSSILEPGPVICLPVAQALTMGGSRAVTVQSDADGRRLVGMDPEMLPGACRPRCIRSADRTGASKRRSR